jgi:hypothetical protein
MLSCTKLASKDEQNSIVGTWVITEITHNGEKYDETGYSTFTKGGFWAMQLKTPNELNLTNAPQTFEEYQSVLNSYKAAFGSYKLKGDSCYCYSENDLKPQFVGNVIPGKYTIENDTLIFDVGDWRYSWKRQE